MKFKPGDIIYCPRDYSFSGSCECVAKVLSLGEVAYHVQSLSPHACAHIYYHCCARGAVKVSTEFVKYLQLFEPRAYLRRTS